MGSGSEVRAHPTPSQRVKSGTINEWSIQLSPGLNLDTADFLTSPNATKVTASPAFNPYAPQSLYQASPVVSCRRSSRRLTPLKRKLEESGIEYTTDVEAARDTPQGASAATVGVNTVKQQKLMST